MANFIDTFISYLHEFLRIAQKVFSLWGEKEGGRIQFTEDDVNELTDDVKGLFGRN